MAEENAELLSSLLGMLGDNPEEKIKAALSSIGIEKKEEEKETITNKSDFDPEMILKIGSLLKGVGGEDERLNLLYALKPFLSEEKKTKIDGAAKLLKLAKMAETAQKSDLFNNLKL